MSDGRALRHFRRRHRLTSHVVLYEGPYTKTCGLERLFAAAPVIRERFEDVVIAAIPAGPVDRRYRDRCERRALALGHRGIVEWSVTDEERELWRSAAGARLSAVTGRGDGIARQVESLLAAGDHRCLPAVLVTEDTDGSDARRDEDIPMSAALPAAVPAVRPRLGP